MQKEQNKEVNIELEQLKSEIEQKQKEIEDHVDTLKHLQADFQNFTKRVEKDKTEFALYSSYKVLAKLISVIDAYEKALENLRASCTPEQVNGLEMINKQLHRLLEEEGVKAIPAIGNKLDPFKHDVVDIVNGDEDNVVIAEVQKGYAMREKILRPTKVIISQKKEEQ